MKTPSLLLTLAVSLLATFFLSACGGGGADAAVGTWALDGKATLDKNRAAMEAEMEGQPKEAIEMGMVAAEAMFSQLKLSMTIAADGTMTGSGTTPAGETSMTGTWTLDGETLTMNTTDNTGQKDTSDATVDGDQLVISKTQGGRTMQMVFTRQ